MSVSAEEGIRNNACSVNHVWNCASVDVKQKGTYTGIDLYCGPRAAAIGGGGEMGYVLVQSTMCELARP